MKNVNPKVTVLFTPAELSRIEELEEHYHLSVIDLIKCSLNFVYKEKPPLSNISTIGQMDVTTMIFSEIMNVTARFGPKRSNIFVDNSEKAIIVYLCREFTYGESAMLKFSKNRMEILQQAKKSNPGYRIQIMLAYRFFGDEEFQLFFSDIDKISQELFKVGKNGTYFYVNKFQQAHLEESQRILGSRYCEILDVLNKEPEEK